MSPKLFRQVVIVLLRLGDAEVIKPFLNWLLITLVVAVAASILLGTCNYYLLWKLSLGRKCGGQKLGAPAPPLPHLVRFRGQVVGKNLCIIQHRWLRGRCDAVDTKLSLITDLPRCGRISGMWENWAWCRRKGLSLNFERWKP